MNIFNNVILARNRQLPDDDRMIETCRSIFKSFNINNLSVCIGWCTDQVTCEVHGATVKKTDNIKVVNFAYFYIKVHTVYYDN